MDIMGYIEDAYYKALKVIDSCVTNEHFESAATYIENYRMLMQSKADKCFSFSKTITLSYEIYIREILLYNYLDDKKRSRWELIDCIYSMATF